MFRTRFILTTISITISAVAPAQTMKRASVDSGGLESNGNSSAVSISSDGRYAAFSSSATNLVPGDSNASADVFLRDLLTGVTTRVSVDSAGVQGNGNSDRAVISADGRFIAFRSDATNLVAGDTNALLDIFVHDLVTGETERVSVDSAGAQAGAPSDFPSLSADGRYVTFMSEASNLVPGDTNAVGDVFVRDRLLQQTVRVSVDSSGMQGDGLSRSYSSAISADGRYVVFESFAANLAAGDTNGRSDIFVRDLVAGQTTRASVDSLGLQGDLDSFAPSISADGRFAAFESLATNLVAGDTNAAFDVFVRDLVAGQTTRVSIDSSGVQGDFDSGFPSWLALSADGREVAFTSFATNLVAGDTNGAFDVFVHDRQTGATVRISAEYPGAQADSDSLSPSISGDGHYVAFESFAANLVPEDVNGVEDVFVYDRISAPVVAYCFGDGLDFQVSALCPCFNFGAVLHGCANAATADGSKLDASGTSRPDAVVLVASGEPPTSLSIFLQGDAPDPFGAVFGDGVLCIGGGMIHLYSKRAVGGVVSAPTGVEPSISARSAALGDPIAAGSVRYYQTYYRDPHLSFCSGSGFNVSNAIAIHW